LAQEITVKLTVFIPSDAVTYSVLGYGGTFNGGVKCAPEPKIDLDVSGPGSLVFPTPSWGTTREYLDSDSLPVSGKPDWYRALKAGAAVQAEERLERTTDNLNATFAPPAGATHGVFFKVVGANPLLTLAPAIDAEITVGLRKRGSAVEYMVAGEHDGFPSYVLTLNGKEVYNHDCVAKGETPSALKPWMDISANIGWTRL